MKPKYDTITIINKARRLTTLCLALVFALLFSGCVKNDQQKGCTSNSIVIAPVIAQGRVTGNNFDPGDEIGIYAVNYPGVPSADNYAANIPYNFNGIDWAAPGGAPLPWPGSNNLNLYAYWPFKPDLTTGNPRAYDFTIKPDQSTEDRYLDNDFLWASATDVPLGTAVPLQFMHNMARVQINLVSAFDAGANWPAGAEIVITGLLNEMTIDLYDGSITPKTLATAQQVNKAVDSTTLVLNGMLTNDNTVLPRDELDILPLVLKPATGYDISLAAIVMPQAVQTGVPLLKVTLDGNDYMFIPTEDFSLKRGVTLNLNLTLVNQPPGLVLDLDQIDWSASRVWNVYNGTTIVAQVCREYLQGSTAPDVQAVVVYLADQNGVDFSSGFAARIYQGDKNGSGEYDINLQSVHGGSVDFSSSTLYQQGTLAPVRKVAIDPGVGIYGSYNAASFNLTLKAATVSDYDGNTYPVVKINQWYWTASNLRTTHYMNGNSFNPLSYNGNPANVGVYGYLYTGYIVYTPQPLLPSPWRVPLETDYDAMVAYLQPMAGSKIKANTLWTDLSMSNDVTGFRMLPGGYYDDRNYYQLGNIAYWWTDTYNGFEGIYYIANSNTATVSKGAVSHDYAMSVRMLLTDKSVLTKIPAD